MKECGIKTKIFETALGWAGVAASDAGIVRIVLPRASRKSVERELASAECGVRNAERPDRSAAARPHTEDRAEAVLSRAVELLQQYFSGKQVRFDLPMDLRGHTAFRRSVWQACRKISPGTTRSYGWLAERVGKPKAARAVGQAMGANPVPVIIP